MKKLKFTEQIAYAVDTGRVMASGAIDGLTDDVVRSHLSV